MPLDLHVHTTASDGAFSPSEVVRDAAAHSLSAIAITDHDTTDGLDEAARAARNTSLEVIPGVELSAEGDSASGVHILGLLVDALDPALTEILRDLRRERDVRARTMVRMLAESGHPLDFDAVARIAGTASVGRVHVARALLEIGSVRSIEEAFRLHIGRGAPCYVRKRTLDAAQAVRAIHAAGGVAVLAHPGVSGEEALPTLLEAGLDGIEAFHAEHSPKDRARFATVAAREGLLVTGGSDFHAPDLRSAPIGGGACPEGAVAAIRERAERYRA